jgi:PAS domain S-box-containing protein
MKGKHKTKEQLISELAQMRQRMAELEASEAERKRIEQALRESEEKFSKVFSSSGNAICIISLAENKLIEINESFTRFTGYTREEVIGRSGVELGLWVKKEELERWTNTLREKGKVYNEEFHSRMKSGEIRVGLASAETLNIGGEPCRITVIADITERKRAEEALKEYSERLEEMVEERTQELRDAQEQLIRKEKLAVLGQLAGGVGHELRNPLGAISNAVYFLNMVLEEPDPDVQETLEILQKEVKTSEMIISSLLDFARAKLPTRRKVDVNDVVQEALSRVTVPENVKVVNQLDGRLPIILADSDQLGQVFGNIILNAVQAMPDGGQLVMQSEVPSPEWVAVSFTDTGVGIPEENLGKLFEPLFTTKAKGIGLGMTVTKTLVEGHGGKIEVESEVGVGTTFTVRLPISVG